MGKGHDKKNCIAYSRRCQKEQFSLPMRSSYLMISLSLKMQVDSNGGKANPSICAQETIQIHYYAQSSPSLYRIQT